MDNIETELEKLELIKFNGTPNNINAWNNIGLCYCSEYNNFCFSGHPEVIKMFQDFINEDIDEWYVYERELMKKNYHSESFRVFNYIFTLKNDEDDVYFLSVDFYSQGFIGKWHIMLENIKISYFTINKKYVIGNINNLDDSEDSDDLDNSENLDDSDDDIFFYKWQLIRENDYCYSEIDDSVKGFNDYEDLCKDDYKDMLKNYEKSIPYKAYKLNIKNHIYNKINNGQLNIEEMREYLNNLYPFERVQVILTFLDHVYADSGK
jgi:hypothetical protein